MTETNSTVTSTKSEEILKVLTTKGIPHLSFTEEQKRNPFNLFASELLLYLFSFLDFKELCTIAQADNDICWAVLCEKKGWKTVSSPIANPLATASYNTRTASKNATSSFPWKNMYKCKLAAEQSRSEVVEVPPEASPKKRARDSKKDEKSSKKR